METTDLIMSFDDLLNDFERASPASQLALPTYLELTGKGHKEDVISNVLAFFFDPNQPHGLGTLFYSTFMKCIGVDDDLSDEQILAVSREVTTAKGLRIDLVVETSKRILAIENKIKHWLNNDLDEYAAHIRRLDKVKTCHLAILSLYPQLAISNLAPNVTYEPFINALELELKSGNIKVADNYAPFLADFFTTVRNLKPRNMIDENLRKYFIEKGEIIDSLIAEKSKFNNEISTRIHGMLELFDVYPKVEKTIWGNFAVNRRIFPNGLKLQVACCLDLQGYWIKVFVERHGADESTKAVLEAIPYFTESNNWLFWLDENDPIPFDTPIREVANQVNEILSNVFPKS